MRKGPVFGGISASSHSVAATWVPGGDTPSAYRVWPNPLDFTQTIDVDFGVFSASPAVGGWGGSYTWLGLPSNTLLQFTAACVYPDGNYVPNSFYQRTLPDAGTAPTEQPPPGAVNFTAVPHYGGQVDLSWVRTDPARVHEILLLRLSPEVRLLELPAGQDPGRFTDHVPNPGQYHYRLRTIAPQGHFTDADVNVTVSPAPAPMPYLPPPHYWHPERFGVGMTDTFPWPALTAVSWGNKRIDAVWNRAKTQTGDVNLVRRVWTGSDWEWQDPPAIPGTDASGSGRVRSMALSTLGLGHLDFLYVRQGAPGVWHSWWDGSTWRQAEHLLWGDVTEICSVGWPTSDRLQVFYTTSADQRLRYREWNDGWQDEEIWGGEVAGRPSASAWAEGRVDVFHRSSDGHLIHWWRSTPTSGPGSEDLGGSLTSDPSAVSDALNSIHVLYNTGGKLVDRRWIDGRGFVAESALEDTSTSHNDESRAPAAASWGPGHVDVFFVRQEGVFFVWQKYYDR